MESSKIGAAIQRFLSKHLDIERVNVTDTGVDIYFKDNPTEPFSLSEFLPKSRIRRDLIMLEAAIYE